VNIAHREVARVHILLSPLGGGLLLALILLPGWRRLPRVLRALLLAGEALMLFLCCPVGANLLVHAVEARVSDACGAETPSTIVLLSAGLQRAPLADDDFAALEEINIDRLLAARALWRRTPGASLVIAGGGPWGIAESAVLTKLAEQLGVPTEALRAEGKSQNTWENAQQVRTLQPAPPPRIALVSSALHLPRALIAFRAAGFTPCTVVSDSLYAPPGGDIGYWLPQSSALVKSELAIHEWIGDWLYRWRARSAKSE
jgi:uncharacterized SAM-binding protein YcdF (DUF218 family)